MLLCRIIGFNYEFMNNNEDSSFVQFIAVSKLITRTFLTAGKPSQREPAVL